MTVSFLKHHKKDILNLLNDEYSPVQYQDYNLNVSKANINRKIANFIHNVIPSYDIIVDWETCKMQLKSVACKKEKLTIKFEIDGNYLINFK